MKTFLVKFFNKPKEMFEWRFKSKFARKTYHVNTYNIFQTDNGQILGWELGWHNVYFLIEWLSGCLGFGKSNKEYY